MTGEPLQLVRWERVPRVPALFGGVLLSCLFIALTLPQIFGSNVRLKKTEPKTAKIVPLEMPQLKSSDLASSGSKSSVRRTAGLRPNLKSKSLAKLAAPIGDGELSLGVRARRATNELMMNFRFNMNHGFNPGPVFQFAYKTRGELPKIAPEEVPYEQYVIVEVTIDVDGTVAEAQIKTGKVPPQVEQKLIATIRGFRYTPATRDGVPIPSLVDIVIHVPNEVS